MTVSLIGPVFCKFPFKYVFAELKSYSFILTPKDMQIYWVRKISQFDKRNQQIILKNKTHT